MGYCKKPLPPLSVLERVLSYNKETGEFIWRKMPEDLLPEKNIRNGWNKKFAGTSAGSVYKMHGREKLSIGLFGESYLLHRIAWVMGGNEMPHDDFHIDHINGNPLDNRLCNLRVATNSQNVSNGNVRKNNTSGIRGVSYFKRDRKWGATIRLNGKTLHLGTFNTKGEAAIVSAKASLRYFGKFSPYYRQAASAAAMH